MVAIHKKWPHLRFGPRQLYGKVMSLLKVSLPYLQGVWTGPWRRHYEKNAESESRSIVAFWKSQRKHVDTRAALDPSHAGPTCRQMCSAHLCPFATATDPLEAQDSGRARCSISIGLRKAGDITHVFHKTTVLRQTFSRQAVAVDKKHHLADELARAPPTRPVPPPVRMIKRMRRTVTVDYDVNEMDEKSSNERKH
ncbi:MAG: hypothetical protein JKY23_00340 [Nitrospinaceae bacterium]|nr:hypothetical protein [Nitrospinaceae bacterium]